MSSETLQLINQIIEVCVIPLLGVLVSFLIKYIDTKSKELEAQTDSVKMKKYISMLSETISNCVIATNQTYVDSLKKQGKFDTEAQKAAFKLTLSAVQAVISDEAKEYLTQMYGDLNTYITNQIEATVSQNKTAETATVA